MKQTHSSQDDVVFAGEVSRSTRDLKSLAVSPSNGGESPQPELVETLPAAVVVGGNKEGRVIVRMPDGGYIIKGGGWMRVLGPPHDPRSSGQWGRTGQGGGGAGGGSGKAKRGGGGNAPPTPENRRYQPPQMLKAFGFDQKKFDGLDIVGGTADTTAQQIKLARLRKQVALQRAAAEKHEKEAKKCWTEARALKEDKPGEAAPLFERAHYEEQKAKAAVYQADRIEAKISQRIGARKASAVQLATKPESKPKKPKHDKKKGRTKGDSN